MDEKWAPYLLALAIVVFTFFLVTVGLRLWERSKLSKHAVLADVRFKKLPFDSATRVRIEKARQLFDQGWAALKGPEPTQCLERFGQALELDELACGWRKQFEGKLEQIGDYFTMPARDVKDKYYSHLAEAYLVIMLYTVLSLYDKQVGDVHEDFRVVKARMDVCVQLQPKNPMIYKLRGDFLQRFGTPIANLDNCISDFRTAIRLAEADPEGLSLNSHGVDPIKLRQYMLAYCHYHLAGLLHRKKDLKGSKTHYEKALEYADSEFSQLPDVYFGLAILGLLTASREERAEALAQATRFYRDALVAEKKLQAWLPVKGGDISRRLAKELIKKFDQAVRQERGLRGVKENAKEKSS